MQLKNNELIKINGGCFAYIIGLGMKSLVNRINRALRAFFG